MHRLEYKGYRRRFASPFANAREAFATREGILLRIEDREGRAGLGEAAPIPSFGTEGFASALVAVVGLGDRFVAEEALTSLRAAPALRWGLGSALSMLETQGALPPLEEPWPVCALVVEPSDRDAIESTLRQGYRCLKLKIGKRPFAEERRTVEGIAELAEGRAALRLDANASLDARQTRQWLELAAELPVEFIEQPMAGGSEREMLRLAADFPTPLALDESVCAVDDLKRWRDAQWPGVFVLKPSLAGDRAALLEELERGPCDCVYSSALETAIGTWGVLDVALAYPNRRRPLGLGVEGLFTDRAIGFEAGPFLQPTGLPSSVELQDLWNRI